MVVVVAVLLAATLLDRIFADDSPATPVAPSIGTTVMTHPREGAMYHQPYTSTR
jgi:hypothetical protein